LRYIKAFIYLSFSLSFLVPDAARSQVGFHVFDLTSSKPAAGSPIPFAYPLYNLGQGYSTDTGKFTAPIAGLYFFIANAGVNNVGNSAKHNLMVDSEIVSSAYTYYHADLHFQISSAPGVVHLNKGQTVWVRADGRSNYVWGYATHFCGFLISPDME
jgi:hypothetical protein